MAVRWRVERRRRSARVSSLGSNWRGARCTACYVLYPGRRVSVACWMAGLVQLCSLHTVMLSMALEGERGEERRGRGRRRPGSGIRLWLGMTSGFVMSPPGRSRWQAGRRGLRVTE